MNANGDFADFNPRAGEPVGMFHPHMFIIMLLFTNCMGDRKVVWSLKTVRLIAKGFLCSRQMKIIEGGGLADPSSFGKCPLNRGCCCLSDV